MDNVKFYKCLADDTRLQCILLIHQEKELCVCELTEALGTIQPKISRHLAQLRSSGVLQDRRQGQWIFYSIHPELPSWAKDVIATTHTNSFDYLQASTERLRVMGERPDRQAACC
ncbi:metalloregulator ArsR/SmtB family transcription factor [Sessilibacter corallicola]|uniref:Metalloregulator ArsR/SmtB family transcription factor n=1 Tax=Sessilibacter corallicola TaxID=2904075 RepID=A0ABQ0ADW5_9GAMM|nr:metalloregulator ArsR/SmtB family transcription factor [Sessilibacter corallicola]